MSDGLPVDPLALREEVKSKYRAVAVDPLGSYHFHTGRPLTARRFRQERCAISTCGPIESPAACRVQAGGICLSKAVSSMSG
jgi:hypothetical protein